MGPGRPFPFHSLHALYQFPSGNHSPISCLRIFLRAKYCRGKWLKFFSSSTDTEVSSMVFTFSHLGGMEIKKATQGQAAPANQKVEPGLSRFASSLRTAAPFHHPAEPCGPRTVLYLKSIRTSFLTLHPPVLVLLCSKPPLPSCLNSLALYDHSDQAWPDVKGPQPSPYPTQTPQDFPFLLFSKSSLNPQPLTLT